MSAVIETYDLPDVKPRHHFLKTYAERWSEKARSGDWEKTLKDPRSYVNDDKSYEAFASHLLSALVQEQPSSVLDVGCGTCSIWEDVGLSPETHTITGIDVALGMLEKANERYPDARFIRACATEIGNYLEEPVELAFSRGVLINHMGIDYFGKILDAVGPLVKDFFLFDYVCPEYFYGKNKKPSFPLYNQNDIAALIEESPFRDWNLTYFNKVDRGENHREPVVILDKYP